MSEHTPGPWRLGKDDITVIREALDWLAHSLKTGAYHTNTSPVLGPKYMAGHADALRAKLGKAEHVGPLRAAPELLAAAHRYIHWRDTDEGGPSETIADDFRAAIAKAEGRQ